MFLPDYVNARFKYIQIAYKRQFYFEALSENIFFKVLAEEQTRIEIKLAGFGGQGIALLGAILGRAAQLHGGKRAVFTQSYGPESRGGASSSDVVIDTGEIDFPYTSKESVDYFIVMSKEAYHKFVPYMRKGGTMFYDPDLVEIDNVATDLTDKIHVIPATDLAEKLGYRIVANIIMMGFFAKHAGGDILPEGAIKKAVLSSVPPRFKELNERAFQAGYDYKGE